MFYPPVGHHHDQPWGAARGGQATCVQQLPVGHATRHRPTSLSLAGQGIALELAPRFAPRWRRRGRLLLQRRAHGPFLGDPSRLCCAPPLHHPATRRRVAGRGHDRTSVRATRRVHCHWPPRQDSGRACCLACREAPGIVNPRALATYYGRCIGTWVHAANRNWTGSRQASVDQPPAQAPLPGWMCQCAEGHTITQQSKGDAR